MNLDLIKRIVQQIPKSKVTRNPDDAAYRIAKLAEQLSPMNQVRFEEALNAGQKPLVHWSTDPKTLMSQGINFRRLSDAAEPYKPAGLYWADEPAASERLTWIGAGGLDHEPNWRNFILGTTYPENLPPAIDDSVLANRMNRWMEGQGAPTELHTVHGPTSDLIREYPHLPIQEYKDVLTRTLKEKADFATIDNTDNIEGLKEYIQLKPGKVQSYYKDIYKLLGPAAGVGIASNSQDAEAMPLPMNPNTLAKLAKFLPEEAIARLRAKALASEASSTQDILGQWMKQSYPQTVEGTSIFKGTPTQKLEETAHTLRNRVEVDPTIPAEEIFRTYSKVMGHANATEDEAKALARYTSNYEDLERLMTSENYQRFKKWAGIPALAALGVASTSQDSEAGMLPHVRKAYKAALAALGPEAKPLYHFSQDVDSLIKNPRTDLGANEPWKPLGIYASDNLVDNMLSRVGDTGTLTNWKQELRKLKGTKQGMVRIVPNPKAKQISVPEDKLITSTGPDIDPITVLPKHDILKILEPDMGMVESEYILNNPKMFQMFSDTKAYIPKIIAGSVLGGTAATLTPNDAEAGVKLPTKVTDLVKLLNTSTRHESGFKRLANKPINLTYKGQSNPYTVVDVLKRKGDNYVVLVKDSEGRRLQVPMTKDYFSAFLGAQGTEDYLKLFNNQGAKGQEFMSTKSLGIREAKRSADDFSLSEFKAWNQSQVGKVKEIDSSKVKPYVYFQSTEGDKPVYIMQDYANILQAKGYGKILRAAKDTGASLDFKQAVKQQHKARVTMDELDRIAKSGEYEKVIEEKLLGNSAVQSKPSSKDLIDETFHDPKSILTRMEALQSQIVSLMHDRTYGAKDKAQSLYQRWKQLNDYTNTAEFKLWQGGK